MIFNFQVNPKTVKEISTVNINFNDVAKFPALNIGIDSYVVSSAIHTAINFDADYVHNIQIGNYCSIATNLTMMIEANHDYKSVTTSAASFLPKTEKKIKRKGQIIIQNDVWIGHYVTIMSGVKIGNGAVIGAGSVVAKDIPPYAIAVGNPCRVIRYRFTPDQIEKLQLIRWWDFNSEDLKKYANFFSENIDVFIDRFYPEALEKYKTETFRVPEKSGFLKNLYMKTCRRLSKRCLKNPPAFIIKGGGGRVFKHLLNSSRLILESKPGRLYICSFLILGILFRSGKRF